jgi:competence protein ComEA
LEFIRAFLNKKHSLSTTGSWGAWIHADALVSLASAAMVVAFNHPGRRPVPRMEKIMKTFRKLLVTCLLCLLFGVAHADVIDINSADASVLAANISGIGPTRAEVIVAYRNVNGPFGSVGDLMLVKGIGGSTVDENRENLTARKP